MGGGWDKLAGTWISTWLLYREFSRGLPGRESETPCDWQSSPSSSIYFCTMAFAIILHAYSPNTTTVSSQRLRVKNAYLGSCGDPVSYRYQVRGLNYTGESPTRGVSSMIQITASQRPRVHIRPQGHLVAQGGPRQFHNNTS